MLTTRMNRVMKELERTYGVKVHVMNSKYYDQTIHAHFSSKDTIYNVMEIVRMLVPGLNFNIDGKIIYIK